jgi:hypothetical protein
VVEGICQRTASARSHMVESRTRRQPIPPPHPQKKKKTRACTHWICPAAYCRYPSAFSPKSAASSAVKAALAAKRLAAQSLK